MLWIKAFHIIAMVAWFSGLFYLPRLFVYHANTLDHTGHQRFCTMEYKLYYYIMWPAGVLTTLFGAILFIKGLVIYKHMGWMHAKLFFVCLTWCFHLSLGHYTKRFKAEKKTPSSIFFRYFNEAPTLLLIIIIILVVVKPF